MCATHYNPGTARPMLFRANTETDALKLITKPGSERTLSANAMMVVIRLVGSGLTGSDLTKARSLALIPAAACCRALKLVRLAKSLNLVGLIEDRSCSTPKVGTESWTTGSWNRKLGTTPFKMLRILEVTLPRPAPPGTARFFAMDPTSQATSGDMPRIVRELSYLYADTITYQARR